MAASLILIYNFQGITYALSFFSAERTCLAYTNLLAERLMFLERNKSVVI